MLRISLVLALGIALCWGPCVCSGQEKLNYQSIIPKDPTVSSLEKFISYPVDMHTGMHNVSIPLHEIALKEMKIPLVLRYHSAGFKVAEMADIVGLGWNLNSTGVVSSNVNGLPDEVDWTTGVYDKISNPSTIVSQYGSPGPGGNGGDLLGGYVGDDIDLLRNVMRGYRDTQPDTYFFSTPTISGKFFFDENGVARSIPHSKIQITRNIEDVYVGGQLQSRRVVGYVIKDENGNKYEFMDMEYVETSSSNSCNLENGSSQTHRSFYLTKITTRLNEVIDYFYTSYNYNFQNPAQGTRARNRSTGTFDCNNMNYFPCMTNSTSYFTDARRLDRITTSYGDEIRFNYPIENRKDLPAAKALESVEFFKQGTLFKRFTFSYDYFHSATENSTNPNDFRLKLNSVKQDNKEPYAFEYYSGSVPSRLSSSTDHWGFSGSGSFFPFDQKNGFLDGNLRDPVLSTASVGVLKKLTYPTKGTLEFEYQLNSYFVEENYMETENIGIVSLDGIADQTVTATFTVPMEAASTFIQWNNNWDGLNVYNDWCYIRLRGPHNYAQDFYSTSPNNNGEFLLEPGGQYSIEIAISGFQFNGGISLYYKKDVPKTRIENRDVGGLRISKIKNCPGQGQSCIETFYEYTNDLSFGGGQKQSSGILFYEPKYITEFDRIVAIEAAGLQKCYEVTCNNITQSSSSLTPLVNSQGTHIVYGQVTTYTGSKANGMDVHKFLVDISNNRPWVGFPYPPLITFDWLNGLPDEDIIYDGNGNVVARTKYHYNYTSVASRPVDPNEKVIAGMKVDLKVPPVLCASGGTLYPIEFAFGQFSLISSWHYMTGKEESIRDAYGNFLTSVTEYFYDNPDHIQQTRQRFTNSKGLIRETTLKYPLDYDRSVMNGSIGVFNDANLITPVINSTTRLNSNIIASSIIEYNSLGLPVAQYELEIPQPVYSITDPATNSSGLLTGYLSDNRYSKRLALTYSTNNNLIQVSTNRGETTSYLWGYQGAFPIAEVKNATYNQISTALGSSVVDDLFVNTNTDASIRTKLNVLRSAPTLPGAMVRSFTFHPSGAISSVTDANGTIGYFTFDAANRLETIRDNDLNIVKAYKYHYKP
jgi:hypothetical protein